MKQPAETAWHQRFREWVRAPCPDGEWLYRGQPARFASVQPSLWREGHSDNYRRRGLYNVDMGVAEDILLSSPVFGGEALFPGLVRDADIPGGEALAHALGVPPSFSLDLSFTELIKALAQHYGFATFFVDVTLNPVVAAMFATHAFGEHGYAASDESATVFRWPATRMSRTRLQIAAGGESEDEAINVVDLTGIHAMMRRPHTQQACLATPVSDPKPIYQPFWSPIDRLEIVDMADLDNCERFELPAGAGAEVARIHDVSMNALIPNRIDLGYSYLSVIGLLSLIVHRPSDQALEDEAAAAEGMHRRAISVGQTLLDRECLRLVPGVAATQRAHRYSFREIRGFFDVQVDAARRAVHLMQEGSLREEVNRRLSIEEDEMRQEAKARYAAWADAVGSAMGEEVANAMKAQGAPAYTLTRSGDYDWIESEIDRRHARLNQLTGSLDRVPIYALDEPDRYANLLDAFERDAGYEGEVAPLAAAVRRWNQVLEVHSDTKKGRGSQ